MFELIYCRKIKFAQTKFFCLNWINFCYAKSVCCWELSALWRLKPNELSKLFTNTPRIRNLFCGQNVFDFFLFATSDWNQINLISEIFWQNKVSHRKNSQAEQYWELRIYCLQKFQLSKHWRRFWWFLATVISTVDMRAKNMKNSAFNVEDTKDFWIVETANSWFHSGVP